MKERQYGRIVNTSSGAGLFGSFGQANYGAVKAGLLGLTRVLAVEGGKAGITADVIAPAAFTRMTADLVGDLGAGSSRRRRSRRWWPSWPTGVRADRSARSPWAAATFAAILISGDPWDNRVGVDGRVRAGSDRGDPRPDRCVHPVRPQLGTGRVVRRVGGCPLSLTAVPPEGTVHRSGASGVTSRAGRPPYYRRARSGPPPTGGTVSQCAATAAAVGSSLALPQTGSRSARTSAVGRSGGPGRPSVPRRRRRR